MSSENESQGLPDPYKLGLTLGKIEGHLGSIDEKLEAGNQEMAELKSEQKKITQCKGDEGENN